MHFGFSYIGLIFLLMLFIPNFFWTKNKPKDRIFNEFDLNGLVFIEVFFYLADRQNQAEMI